MIKKKNRKRDATRAAIKMKVVKKTSLLSFLLICFLVAGSQTAVAPEPAGDPHIVLGTVFNSTTGNIDANDGTVTVYLEGQPLGNLTDIIGVNGDSNQPNMYKVNLGNSPFPVWIIGNTVHIIAQKTVGGATYTNHTTLVLTGDFVQECNLTLPGPPDVTVLYPDGGENISIGGIVNVSANATDDDAVTGVNFSYSADGGNTWTAIGAGSVATGTIWNATWDTFLLTTGTNYRIKANATDGTYFTNDTSDTVFSLIDNTKPLLRNATAVPSTIVVNITNTTLWVDVTDRYSSISGDVTVNLTSIGGDPDAIMECNGYHIEGSLNWSVRFRTNVSVTSDAYIDDHCLPVNVSDTYGNYNDTVCIPVSVVSGVPPTNLTAILNDDGTINVTWEGTLGAPYDIYITENYQAGFPDTPNVTEITNLTWRDANAPSYAHRYYRVGFGGIRNDNETVGKYDLSLYNPPSLTNLNLINPCVLNTSYIATATNLTSAIAGSTATSMWDSEIQKLVDWIPLYGGVGIDFAIDPGYAYWIDVPENTTWTINGSVRVGNITVNLYNPPGLTNLNLIAVGLNDTSISNATNLTSAIAGSTATSMWDSEIQKLVDWIPLYGGVGIDFAIDPGYGYWIDVPANTTWTHPQ